MNLLVKLGGACQLNLTAPKLRQPPQVGDVFLLLTHLGARPAQMRCDKISEIDGCNVYHVSRQPTEKS